jgi:hypothetical protein
MSLSLLCRWTVILVLVVVHHWALAVQERTISQPRYAPINTVARRVLNIRNCRSGSPGTG